MKIGIDGSCLANRRGFGRFTRLLVAALARQPSGHDFTVFVDRPSALEVEIPDGFQRVVVNVGEAPAQAARAHGRRRWRDMLAMGGAVAAAELDLIYFPATYSYFPVWKVPRVVVTMHDTLTLTHPELVFPTFAGRLAWRLKEGLAARQADRIVTVSAASRQALKHWTGWPDERFRVINEGPDPIFAPAANDPRATPALARHGIARDERYLLYVGGLSPHKNLPRLVDAFARGAPGDVRLVLVGDLGDVFHTHVPEIKRRIAHHALADRVVFTGYVPDDALVFLYSRAAALVQPSLMEGFGLPPVEAMACGAPVLASRAGSLPEVVGDAGLYFDPTDVDSMATAIATFFRDGSVAPGLARRARARAALFTWDAAARDLVACFEELDTTRYPARSFTASKPMSARIPPVARCPSAAAGIRSDS